MRASLKSSQDRRIEDAICNLLPMGNHQSRSVKIHIVACCTDSEAGGRRHSLQPRLERQQSLIIMTLHKLRFNVNKETNIIISQLDSTARRAPTPVSLPPSPTPPTQLALPVLVVPSTSWPDVKVRAQTWRIICGCRKIFPAAAFSCHMQLAAAAI